MVLCGTDSSRASFCRDVKAATSLKFISIFTIFFTSIIGISLPVLLARLFQGKPAYDRAVLIIKCFAAGVILSTSLVHVLPDAYAALADCQVSTRHPWKDFPFSGLVTLIGVLTALLVDLTATSHVESHVSGSEQKVLHNKEYTPVGSSEDLEKKSVVVVAAAVELRGGGGCCAGGGGGGGGDDVEGQGQAEEMMIKLKQQLVSQVLEIGIIFHSVIIGVTMGMSQNKCTIRPLIAALSFHQIFEGMGLGGCIAQAGFSFGTTAYMCMMFSVTTPMGIILGMVVFSMTGYDDNSPNALIMEGLLGSLSSGILIYMGLVDLIALDFFHNKLMGSHPLLKRASFIALVLGSTSMSILALWA